MFPWYCDPWKFARVFMIIQAIVVFIILKHDWQYIAADIVVKKRNLIDTNKDHFTP